MEKLKILWIDDDIHRPELMAEVDALEEKGCLITSISHPDQLDINTIPLYDCVLIDLSMPGIPLISETPDGLMTGFALLKKIQKKYPNTKKFVYSFFIGPEVTKYCNDNPNLCYGNKLDYTSNQFADTIIKFIKEDTK